MSKQIQVNLAFNADTTKAKQQINDLVNSLNKIATKDSQIFDDRQLREAATAAKDLTKHLEAAVNVNTGKLDLNKFSQSLSHSKQNLQDLYNSLSKAGPQGQQAFLQLASSIASSESQVLNLNSKVKDLGSTLKNTIKWQLSSSLIHGFMGAMQHAIGYAKDLNSSLNDIRIVTGASAEQMAKFAEQANKSAKALSSTTTEYTKASLIYYQQGLTDAEVKERTDITIKMANVSKESAQVVSDQMTAVWNNFYDGSKSLEYYADVMTALGAATASSVDEIAGGLEKFAAIGDTIGLSYEYAASALATITSNTRQSEEVVGTALKTIFARIQGLKLGETLDDGTTLNKYSQALDKVGISIFDQAGELKKMDNILDELGNKWGTLSKDQQTALAQTVAGTRQYTQLVALMENWDKGDSDSFKSNLQTIATSEGALQEQQDIYAESWEAAADRVKAATEDIYDSLINDEAIVVLLNGLEKILDFTGALIDGFGGLKGILLFIGATFTKSFAKEMPGAIDKLKTNLKIITGQAQKEKIANIEQAQSIIKNNKGNFKGGDTRRANATVDELESLKKLEMARSHLTDAEYDYVKGKIQERKAIQESIASREDEIASIDKEFKKKSKDSSKKSAKKVKTSVEVEDSLKADQDALQMKEKVMRREKEKIERKAQKPNYHLTPEEITNLETYTKELEKIEQRNNAIKKSMVLEQRRKEILEAEGIQTEHKNDQGIVQSAEIDEKQYEVLIQKKQQELQKAYQKRESARLTLEDHSSQTFKWDNYAASLTVKGKGGKGTKEVESLRKSVEVYSKSLKEAMDIAGQPITTESWDKLTKSLEDTEASAESIIAAFKRFSEANEIDKATENIQELTSEIKDLRSDLQALDSDGFEEIAIEAENAGEAVANTQHKIQQLENESGLIDIEVEADASDISATLTDVASLAMDIGTIFSSLTTMVSIWGDESASASEKFMVSMSSLGASAMSTMQIVQTMTNPTFVTGLTNIGKKLQEVDIKIPLLTKGIQGLGGKIAGTTGVLGKFLLLLGGAAVAIAAITAIIWLAVKAFEAWKASTPEGQLKAATEATKEMTAAAESANSAYQTLLNTINGYESAVKSLESLEKGTKEYSDALKQANDEAKKLIESYGLYSDAYYDYDGLIKFKDGSLEQKQTEYESFTREAESALYGNKIRQEEAQANVDIKNITKDIIRDTKISSIESNNSINGHVVASDSYKLSTNTRSLSKDEIDIIAKAITQVQDDAEENNIILDEDAFKFNLAEILRTKELDEAIITNIDTIYSQKDAFEKLTAAANKATEAQNYFAQQILRNEIEKEYGEQFKQAATKNGVFDESLYENMLNATVSMNENVATKLADEYSKIQVSGSAGSKLALRASYSDYSHIYTNEDLARQYARTVMGMSEEEVSNLYFEEADGKYSLKDKAGEAVINNVSERTMLEWLDIEAQKKSIQENLDINGEDAVSNIVDKSTEFGEQYGVNFSQGILNAISNKSTDLDFSYLFNQIDPLEHEELLTNRLQPQELLDSLGITKEAYEAMGFDNAKQFTDAFYAELKNWTEEDFSTGINQEFEALAEGYDINVDEFKAYREMLAETNEELAKNPKLLNIIALQQKRYIKGADKIADIQKDYNKLLAKGAKELKTTGKLSTETMGSLSEILPDLKTAVGDLLDLDADSMEALSPEFLLENWEDITKAINGSKEAYLRVQQAASEEILFNVGLKEGDALFNDFNTLAMSLQSVADMNPVDLKAHLNSDEFLAACTALVNQAGMTQAQAQAYFDELGYEAEVKVVDDPPVSTRTDMQVPVFKMTPDGGVSVEMAQGTAVSTQESQHLQITSINKKSTGGGGYTPPKKSGGGGGGQKKHAEKKSTSERTRYHTLENQLEDLKAEYEEISEAADMAFGQEKLDNIDAQIDKTQELIDKQEEYLAAISQDLPIDKNVMTAYYDDVIGGPAMQFDENGNISNYDAIEEAMFNRYNAMADRYTDDSEEWQVFEKKYEQLEKYIEQYEETYDLLRDEEAAYQDLLNQRMELELEKVQYRVELELDVPENEIAVIEYQLGKIEDDAFESAQAIGLLTAQAEEIYDQIQVNKQAINDIIRLSKEMNNGGLTADQADAIKEYRDNLLDLNEEFDSIRESVEEKLMETFDAFNEQLEANIGSLEHYNSVLESYKNIVDIVGKDTLGLSDQFIMNLNQAAVDNAIDKVNATRDAYEAMMSAQKDAEIALEEAKSRGDTASAKYWEETLKTLTEESQAAQEEMLSAWEDALNGIAEQFEATVERVVTAFNDSIYALGGLEGLQDDFSRQQENADIMLDDYQKIYELSKLSRDINKTIDDTNVIGGKQKLKKLLGEINKLQEDGVEISQYDLEYLQKTYDLRLAELELEEAQKAKSTVRLSRDNEGNWSYVYTQNTDAVDAAQQKYEDALYAMQDLSSNYIDEMSEQLISTSQEMAEALAAIRIQDFDSIDDYYREVERVQEQYQNELAMQEIELQKAIDNNKILYNEDWTNYHNATGYKISDTQNFATTFKDTLLGVLMGSEEDSANFTNIIGSAVNDLTQNLAEGAKIYYDNLNAAMDAAGTSTGNFAEDTAVNIDAVVEKSKEGANAVDEMASKMEESFSSITDTITTWQESYGMAMEEIINSNLAVIDSFNKMLEALSIDADSITVKYDIASVAGAQAQQFDTGGYTGEWGKNGKLAVLHEKELILEPNDTSNFLSAIKITRAMLDTIDLNAKQASFGLGSLTPSTIRDDNTQTLEQAVHITAEFPGVSDHNEIEEAFNNLINTASQYANRK